MPKPERRQPIFPSFTLVVSRHWWLFFRFPSRPTILGPPAYQPRPQRISEVITHVNLKPISIPNPNITVNADERAEVNTNKDPEVLDGEQPENVTSKHTGSDAIIEPVSTRLQPLSDDALSEVSALALNTGFNSNDAIQNDGNSAEEVKFSAL